MTMRLPMTSDTLRHEARVIREAAERAETQMLKCRDAVEAAHKIVRAAQQLADRSADIIYTDVTGNRFQKVFSDDLKELKAALAHGEEGRPDGQ